MRNRVTALRLGVIAAAAILLLTWASPGHAELSDQDRADIARVEVFLNEIRSLKAKFTQVSDTGSFAEGDFYLERPGHLRFEYQPPSPILIVATGKTLIFYDSELGQVSRLPVDSTPLAFLLADRFSFGGTISVQSVERRPGVLAIRLSDVERPGEGTLTLVFADAPLELRQWRVTDAQGRRTTVALTELQTNVTLDQSLFRFVDPDPFGRIQAPGD